MILESIQFSNIYKIADLQAKLDSGYFDDFLVEFSIYLMTEKGLVKINQDKTIEYNVSVDLSNYIKNTDIATRDKLGIIKVGSGLDISNSSLYTVLASNANIDAKSNKFLVITPSNLNYAVKSALSGKINIDDMTEEEQLKARNVIGAIGKTDYAAAGKAGVIQLISNGVSSGVAIDSSGHYLKLVRATNEVIDAKTNVFMPIVPANLDYAVRSVLPEVQTSLLEMITKNCIYDLGEQTTLSITLPATGNVGDWLQFDFLSGSTKTTLEINAESGILGFDLIPESNYIYTMYLDWGMIGKNTDGSINYGWRFNYSEYPLNS